MNLKKMTFLLALSASSLFWATPSFCASNALLTRTFTLWSSQPFDSAQSKSGTCVATLYNQNQIITAAHCLKYPELKLRIPEYNSSISEGERQKINTAFTSGNYETVIDARADIAVITLPFDLNIDTVETFTKVDIDRIAKLHSRFRSQDKMLRLFMLGVRHADYSDDASMPLSTECPIDKVSSAINAGIDLICTGFVGNSGALVILPEIQNNKTYYRVVGVAVAADTDTNYISISVLSKKILDVLK